MKKIQTKKVTLLVFFLYIFMAIFSVLYYEHNHTFYDYGQLFDNCKKNDNTTSELCNTNYEDHELSLDRKTIFYSILRDTPLAYLFIFSFGLIIIASMFNLNKLFNSKYMLYFLQRKKYSSFLKKIICKSYGKVIIIPIFLFILYIFTMLFSNHNDPFLAIELGISSFGSTNLNNQYFIIFYILYITLMHLSYINIGLLLIKHGKNILTLLIQSYLVYFSIETIVELISVNAIYTDIYELGDVDIMVEITIALLYCIISFIMVLLKYKNKEKIIRNLETSYEN